METITLEEAQINLPQLVRQLETRGELLIVQANRPIARLSPFMDRPSLRDLVSSSVGAVLRPFPSPDDDLLDEMTNSSK
jgi:antitoxin (DNA-binding transcriptional repressor) of toxin-antitoxin stability system